MRNNLSLSLAILTIFASNNIPNDMRSQKQLSFDTYNNYNYGFKQALDQVPLSIEAWINIPPSSLGGTIIGNYVNYLVSLPGAFNYEIDPLGQLKVTLDDGNYVHTFKGIHLDDGIRHHLALVKSDSDLKFYLDGVLKDTVYIRIKDTLCTMPISIGVDNRNWVETKRHFEGNIEQITLYSSTIDQNQIKSDMNETEINNNPNLIGNYYFGETWNQFVVKDTAARGPDCYLKTHEKYVDVVKTNDYDYTIVGVPDIQTMVHYQPNKLTSLMRWLLTNKQTEKIKFAAFVGDLSDSGTIESYYQTASKNLTMLNGIIPYSFVQGNHDYDDNCKSSRASTFFDKYFPYNTYSQMDNFVDSYQDGSMSNYCVEYEIDGIKYLVVNLEFGPRTSVLRWAGRMIEKHPQHRVIINTHAYLECDGQLLNANSKYSPSAYPWSSQVEVNNGQEIYDNLVKRYNNVFLVLCGHVCSDDIIMRTSYGENGNMITQLLIDPQATRYNNGQIGEDIILLIRVNETKKTLRFEYYSPSYDKYFNIQNQFAIDFQDENNPTIGSRNK